MIAARAVGLLQPLGQRLPKRKQMVALAAIAGMVLGLGLAILLELLAPGISRPEDLRRTLDVDHLSSMPVIAGEGSDRMAPEKAVRLIVADPSGVYADAVRGARRELDARRRMPGPRIILVASALPNEGAETIAIEISDLSLLRMTVPVNELDIDQISEGMDAIISLDALPDLDIPGQVEHIGWISATSSDGIVTYDVQVVVNTDDAQVRIGMTGEVTIETGSTNS